ncbi:MAG: T9SS type A sorting domain-containing protein [FCB group bacterium]|nr:T9SS type A sorting domain-containing protein [FCB group bacterium]
MRCSEARQRLIESRGLAPDDADGRRLSGHLRECSACAAFARAEQALARDLAAAKANDIADDIPLSTLKTRVESRVRLGHGNQAKESSIMGTVTRQLKKRPSLGISLGVVAVVLALATLIPFTLEQTIGYEVALAGVDKNLAMDSFKIQELLTALGVDDATFNVGDCEATCKVKISDLKSEGDVQMVIAAFDELGNCVLEDITEISGDESATLMDIAKNVIFVRTATMELADGDNEEIHKIVLDRLMTLDSCSEGAFTVWIGDDGENVDLHKVIMTGDSACGEWTAKMHEFDCDVEGNVMKKIMVVGQDGEDFTHDIEMFTTGDDASGEHTTVDVEHGDDGEITMVVTTVDGEVHRINLDDADAVERLEALGVKAHVMNSGDGAKCEVFVCSQDGEGSMNLKKKMEAMHEAHKDDVPAQLPDGYALTQNYPNPFNPTTSIKYNIAETQAVTLEIFNVNGQKVKTLVDEVVTAGEHTVNWNSTDENGQKVASGIYMYRLTAGDIVETKKMTLLK